jgi:hypothetical protein
MLKTEAKQKPFSFTVADTTPVESKPDAALRIYKEHEQVFYASTRLGGVKKTPTGYDVEVAYELIGLRYELKKIGLPTKNNNPFTGTIETEKTGKKETAKS